LQVSGIVVHGDQFAELAARLAAGEQQVVLPCAVETRIHAAAGL